MYGADYLHWCEAEEARTELHVHRRAVLAGLSDEARALIEADDQRSSIEERMLTENMFERQRWQADAFVPVIYPPRTGLFGSLGLSL